MTWLWIVLGIIGYAFIGGALYALFTETALENIFDETFSAGLIASFWVITIPMLLIVFIGYISYSLICYIIIKLQQKDR